MSKSELPLEGYEKFIKGEFLEAISEYKLYVDNGVRILNNLIDTVRKKSKTIVDTPISYKDLKKQKGISSEIFDILDNKLKNLNENKEIFAEIEGYLYTCGQPSPQVKFIIRRLKKHYEKLLDIDDLLYHDIIMNYILDCDLIISNNFSDLDNNNQLKNLIEPDISEALSKNHVDIDKPLLEGIFYERLLST